MVPAIYYHDIFLFVVSLMTIILCTQYAGYTSNRWTSAKKSSWKGVFLFTLFMVVFIGLRPRSEIFADMMGYVTATEEGWWDIDDIRWDTNYLFVPLMFFLSSLHASGEVAMLVLAFIYFGAAMLATSKIFPKDKLLAMVVYCGAFITFANATNGMKAGCATALFLCAVAYFENKIASILFLFLSLGFHHAAQLLLVVYVICYFYRKHSVYLVFWCICLLLAILRITYFQTLFGAWTDDHGAEYLLIEATNRDSGFGGKTGFRYDFVLYSLVPIVLGYYAIYKKNIRNNHYIFMLNVYTLTNAIWMLCMYAPFTNRIAALGWGLYSILILFPVLQPEWHKKNNNVVQIVAYSHLGFTLIMYYIYYQ